LASARCADVAWWNPLWHCRLPATISFGNAARENFPVEVTVNLKTKLAESGLVGTIDRDSVRVVDSKLNEVPSQADWVNETTAEVVWFVNGTAGSEDTFWIYFDVLENGKKSSPNYPSEVIWSEADHTLQNSRIKAVYNGYQSAITELIDKETGVDVANVIFHVAWSSVPGSYGTATNQLSAQWSMSVGPIRAKVTTNTDFGPVNVTDITARVIYYMYGRLPALKMNGVYVTGANPYQNTNVIQSPRAHLVGGLFDKACTNYPQDGAVTLTTQAGWSCWTHKTEELPVTVVVWDSNAKNGAFGFTALRDCPPDDLALALGQQSICLGDQQELTIVKLDYNRPPEFPWFPNPNSACSWGTKMFTFAPSKEDVLRISNSLSSAVGVNLGSAATVVEIGISQCAAVFGLIILGRLRVRRAQL